MSPAPTNVRMAVAATIRTLQRTVTAYRHRK